MNNGFRQQAGMSFYHQATSMRLQGNPFTNASQVNLGRSIWQGGAAGQQYVQQQPRPLMQRQQQNNFQRQKAGNTNNQNNAAQRQQNVPNAQKQNQNSSTTNVQSRLGPAKTPVTAPTKSDPPNTSRPVLLRPGQEKSPKPGKLRSLSMCLFEFQVTSIR